MQKFTIRDIENLTGIKAHTLRVWEQRYGFFQAQRKESMHRFYDNEDLKKLLRVAFLYHTGWKISKIADLGEGAVLEEVRKAASAGNSQQASYVIQLIEAALDFDEYTFTSLLDTITVQIGFEDCITQVCYPYLQKIGLLWSTNNIIPAQEHFTSYIIQNRIIRETDTITRKEKQSPELVLFCPRGEHHELPLLFINYLLKKNHRGTIFLGPNVELPVLEQVASLPGIRYIYFHLITNLTGFFLDDYLEQVCRLFPDKRIIASGVSTWHSQRTFANLTILRSDKEIYEFIRGDDR
jgi:DNA-binding transcriptional MerR regulator